jgi:hypothetical protein
VITSNDLIEKLTLKLLEKQQSINRQLEEYDRKYSYQIEEKKRLIAESEKKLLHQMEVKNIEMKEVDKLIFRQLEANKIKVEDEYSLMEEEKKETAKKTKKKKSSKKEKAADNSAKLSKDDIFADIIDMFKMQGYNFDDETLRLYWELASRGLSEPKT